MLKVEQRWTPGRSEIERERATSFPAWARHLAIGGYREQGWTAFDGNRAGAVVATGEWGHELFLMSDGSIACTEYPEGYAAAIRQPSKGEGE